MANYQNLKNSIAQVIKTNGNQEITGQLLQNTLNNIVNSIGTNYTFAGVATPATNPGAPDQNVFYLAGDGTYANFGNKSIAAGNIGVLKYNGAWSLDLIKVGGDVPINELNISKMFPTGGTGSSNRYTLANAISKVPNAYKNVVGLKITFLSDESKAVETYVFQGGTFSSADSWNKGSSDVSNAIPTENTANIVNIAGSKDTYDIAYNYENLRFNDGVISNASGSIQKGGNGNWFRSDYIPINSNERNSMLLSTDKNANGSWGLAFYDEYYTFISGVAYTPVTDKVVDIPHNARYFRFSSNSNKDKVILIKVKYSISKQESLIDTRIESANVSQSGVWDFKKKGFFFKNPYFEDAQKHYGYQGFMYVPPKSKIKLTINSLTFPSTIATKRAVLIKKNDALNFKAGVYFVHSIDKPSEETKDGTHTYITLDIPDYKEDEPLYLMWCYRIEGVDYDIKAEYIQSLQKGGSPDTTIANVGLVAQMIDLNAAKAEEIDEDEKFVEYLKTTREYNNFELTINYKGKPLTLHKNAFKSIGFIPVTIGQSFRLTFDTYDGQYLTRAGLGVIDGRTMRSIVDGTFKPQSDLSTDPNTWPGGPWAITLDTAILNEGKTKGTLEFSIPLELDGADGLYLVYSNTFFTSTQPLNPKLEKIPNIGVPFTKNALLPNLPNDGLYKALKSDVNIKVYGLGDSTNSDDATRGPLATPSSNLHFSATKIIAKMLNASAYKNFSVPGSGVKHALTSSKNIPDDASHVIIVVGINDINKSMPIGEIDSILAIEEPNLIPEDTLLGCYVKMIKLLRARLSKKAQIVCVSPYYYKDTNVPENIKTFREGLRKMCHTIGSRKGMRFIDGCNAGINPSNWIMLCRDTTHPMMEGQAIIASHIMQHLVPFELAAEQYDLGTRTDEGITVVPSYTPLK